MLDQIAPNVFAWTEIHGANGQRYSWNSHAVRVAADGVLALIDPLQASTKQSERWRRLVHQPTFC